jgi:hypothetical protein
VTIKSSNVFSKQNIRTIGKEDKIAFSPLRALAESCRAPLPYPIETTLKVYRLLLDAGCDINEYDGNGRTPIQEALASQGRFRSEC